MNETVSDSQRLAIVGVIPPPYGGVSVHIQRKLDLLKRNGIATRLYEQRGKSDPERQIFPTSTSAWAFAKLLTRFPERVIHFHFNNDKALMIARQVLRLRRGKRLLLTIHSEKLVRTYDEKGSLYRMLMRDCFRSADHLICVNQNIYDFMQQRLKISSDKLSLIPAFLSPTAEEKSAEHLPDQVRQFLAGKQRIVGTHGWFGYFVDGVHVYSFDHVAKLAQELHERQDGTGIYTLISGCYDTKHREEILALQQKYHDTWLIIESPFPSASLFERTNVFIRPTVTDGDSVSIRECLSMGVPVIASDASPRPDACQVYPSRDYDALSQLMWQSLNRNDSPDEKATDKPEYDLEFETKLVAAIRSVLQDQPVH